MPELQEVSLFGRDLPAVALGGDLAVNLEGVQAQRALAYRNATLANQLVTPLMTDLVRGQMRLEDDWAEFFAPGIQVGAVRFEWPEWLDNNWMERKNTLRAECVPYSYTATEPSKQSDTLLRHSWANKMDLRTLKNATSALNVGARAAGFAARIVKTSFEFELADLISNAASYAAGHVNVLAGAAEWDASASASPYEDVKNGIRTIVNATGARPSDLRMAITYESYHALLMSDEWKARVAVGSSIAGGINEQTTPVEAQLALYFGLGQVKIINPWGKEWDATNDAFVTGPILGDDVVIFLPSIGGGYDDLYGSRWFLSNFRMNAGISSEPFQERKDSSIWWPWDEEWRLRVSDSECAYIIRNTSSLV